MEKGDFFSVGKLIWESERLVVFLLYMQALSKGCKRQLKMSTHTLPAVCNLNTAYDGCHGDRWLGVAATMCRSGTELATSDSILIICPHVFCTYVHVDHCYGIVQQQKSLQSRTGRSSRDVSHGGGGEKSVIIMLPITERTRSSL